MALGGTVHGFGPGAGIGIWITRWIRRTHGWSMVDGPWLIRKTFMAIPRPSLPPTFLFSQMVYIDGDRYSIAGNRLWSFPRLV
jgi:hypothetical protein